MAEDRVTLGVNNTAGVALLSSNLLLNVVDLIADLSIEGTITC